MNGSLILLRKLHYLIQTISLNFIQEFRSVYFVHTLFYYYGIILININIHIKVHILIYVYAECTHTYTHTHSHIHTRIHFNINAFMLLGFQFITNYFTMSMYKFIINK